MEYALVSFFQLVLILVLIKQEKVVVIPASLEKNMWVSSGNASAEYLADMANYFCVLRLNITPDSLLHQRDLLLKNTAPEYYNALKMQLNADLEKMKEERLVSVFFPVDAKVDTKNHKVKIIGDLKTYVGDTALPSKRVKYIVGYTYNGWRFLVNSFEEEAANV